MKKKRFGPDPDSIRRAKMTHEKRKNTKFAKCKDDIATSSVFFSYNTFFSGLQQHGCKYRKYVSTQQCSWAFHDLVRQSLWSCMCREERLNSQLAETRWNRLIKSMNGKIKTGSGIAHCQWTRTNNLKLKNFENFAWIYSVFNLCIVECVKLKNMLWFHRCAKSKLNENLLE